ncbi:MAG TPA: DUF2062 domain-containing protein [Bauldia sp.]|nr:DUF2062 domain-containing protein [Bauldia sp.]
MLFARRTKPSFVERLRYTVWPQSGWGRALRYFAKRILRLSGSPHTVAIGFAAGMFVAWSPFFGFHYLLSAGFAFLCRGNVLAAILGTTVGNPLTLPAMWTLAYHVGDIILGGSHQVAPAMPEDIAGQSWTVFWEFAKPVLVGSIPLGFVSGLISYFLVRFAVTAYQEGRRTRLAQRRLETAAPPSGV